MVTKCTNSHYIYDQADTRVAHGRSQGCARRGTRGEQHNITEAASNELKLTNQLRTRCRTGDVGRRVDRKGLDFGRDRTVEFLILTKKGILTLKKKGFC